ncbi:MAG: RluA family pseudouridine synthase [Lachnospiraceae bacterium]|nr:RluA family pseudouridine synthase [Lachnospiraceae bacterium]
MQKYVIEKKDSGQTVIKFLTRLLKDAPQSLLYKQIRKKNIVLNKKKIDGHEKLSEGDELSIFMSDETIEKFKGAINTDLSEYLKAYDKYKEPDIVYEDEHIIVLNKPVGVLSQKSKPDDLSANEWLIGFLIKEGSVTAASLKEFTPSVCNRLDRNTGGLLLFGKTLFGTSKISLGLKERTIHKYYKTIVTGEITKEEKISGYLNKDEKLNMVFISKEKTDDSVYIETSYKPIRFNKDKNITELEIELITGKPHQIRAHLASINHPIIGDTKYGKKDEVSNLNHHLLYAYKVVFPKYDDYPEISSKTITKSFDDIFNKYF